MSLRSWACVLTAATLSGCTAVDTAQIPLATTYPYSEQQRMQAAQHWQVLARHEAERLLSDGRLRGHSLYLMPHQGGSDFDRGFQSLLTSELVSQGAVVRTSPEAAVLIDFDVQVVSHHERDAARPPRGVMTALAAGIAVATIPFNHWREPSLALIPAASLVDLFSGNWTTTSDHEIIVTTQAVQYDIMLYSSSNLYYISDGDSRQYETQAAASRLAVSTDW